MNRFEYSRKPKVEAHDLEILSKLFEVGFDTVGFNDSAEFVSTGNFALTDNITVSVSLYLRERHAKVFGRTPCPTDWDEQKRSELWSGYLHMELEEMSKDKLTAFIRAALISELAT